MKTFKTPVIRREKPRYPIVMRQVMTGEALYTLEQVTHMLWRVEVRTKKEVKVKRCNTYKRAMHLYASLGV